MKGYINIYKPYDGNTISSYETSTCIYDTKEKAETALGANDDLIIKTIEIEV